MSQEVRHLFAGRRSIRGDASQPRRERRAMALLYMSFAMATFFAALSLAIDYARVVLAKNELVFAARASAIAGAAALAGDPSSVQPAANVILGKSNIDGTTIVSAGTYVVNDLTLLANVVLRVSGPVTFYVSGNCTIAGNVLVASNDPENFKINVVKNGSVSLAGNVAMYCDIYAPLSDVNVIAGLGYSGRLVGKTLNILATSFLHGDENISHSPQVQLLK